MLASNKPRISVIIPVHNEERTIQRCLDSVYATKYPYLEVIVVDDYSNDESVSVAACFPCRIIRLKQNMGPAFARNKGAEKASGEILFFTDSDVCLHEDTLEMVANEFKTRPDLSAVLGSYGKDTTYSNFFSVYKNLVHHYGHQTAREDASTFWSGCGAIRKEVFDEVGGFSKDYKKPSIEDIALGYRLSKRGRRIYLDKQMQVTHCKRYTFFSLIKSDIMDRAVPWTELMLTERVFKNDMSTKSSNIFSTAVAFLALFALISTGVFWHSIYVFAFLFVSFILLNLSFYRFIFKERGVLFTIKSILMNYLSYLYSGAGLLIGIACYLKGFLLKRPKSARADTE